MRKKPKSEHTILETSSSRLQSNRTIEVEPPPYDAPYHHDLSILWLCSSPDRTNLLYSSGSTEMIYEGVAPSPRMLASTTLFSSEPTCSIYIPPSHLHLAKATRRPSVRNSIDCKLATAQSMLYSNGLASKLWRINSIGSVVSAALVKDEEKKAWEECRQLISSMNFNSAEADAILGKAFGWENSPFWGEERSKQVPVCESLSEILDYLRSLGLSDDDLHKVLAKFPELIGCSLDDEVRSNVATLEKQWNIKGKSLRSLLLRNPKVLGYNVDCKGDCIAKCTRCWVRF